MIDEVERRARLISGAMHAMAPDTPTFVAPAPHGPVPLWSLYVEAARLLIADEERRAEEKQIIDFGHDERETVTILADSEVPGLGRVMLRLWPDDLVLWVGGRIAATIMRGKS